MNARPGPVRTQKVQVRNFVAPMKPANLTPSQEYEWLEIISNPYLVATDGSSVIDYMKTIQLRDAAFDAISSDGVFVDDAKGSRKKHPAYQIYREASDRILKLKAILLMTPASRIAAQNITTEEPEEAKGIAALAD